MEDAHDRVHHPLSTADLRPRETHNDPFAPPHVRRKQVNMARLNATDWDTRTLGDGTSITSLDDVPLPTVAPASRDGVRRGGVLTHTAGGQIGLPQLVVWKNKEVRDESDAQREGGQAGRDGEKSGRGEDQADYLARGATAKRIAGCCAASRGRCGPAGPTGAPQGPRLAACWT